MNKKITKTDRFPFNWIELAKDPLTFFTKRTIENDNLIDLGLFLNMKSYLLTKPEDIEHVLVKNNKNYIKSKSYEPLKLSLGKGLITSEGDFWKRQRRIAQPAFHKHVIAGFTDTIGAIVDNMVSQWKKSLDKGVNELNIADEMMKLTVHITSQLLFGADISGKEDKILYLIGNINELSINMLKKPYFIPLWVPTPANLKFKSHLKEIDSIINDIIEKRRGQKTGNHEDLLQMLMDSVDEETGERMDDRQLRDEVVTVFLAGAETSSNALAWTLYLLSTNNEKESKVRKEIEEVVAKGLTGLEALRELRYLNMCMQESMRIYPPAWFVSREAISEDEIDGYKIPEKSQIYISIHGMHMNPKYWTDPEKFVPERFEEKERPKYSYFPFGGGPRLCIGAELARMEIILTLYNIVKEFNFEISDKKVEPEPLITLRPKNGLFMKISKLSKAQLVS